MSAFHHIVVLEKGELFHHSVVDKDKHLSCVLGLERGDCIARSMENYVKLMGIGAVRVRGHRASDIDPTRYPPKELEYLLKCGFPHHYWVEAKGMVYDVHGGACQVMAIDKYYERVHMVSGSVQTAEWGIMFDDEFGDEFGGDDIGLKQNVKYCKDRCLLLGLARCMEQEINRA